MTHSSRCLHSLAVALIGAATGACGRDARAEFVYGRSEDACLQVIPACPSMYAFCNLDEARYAEVVFPRQSPFRFLTVAGAGDTIDVHVFFEQKHDVGSSTTIYWYEPGCTDYQKQSSEGRDLFAEAEGPGSITRRQAVAQTGEHLVEIFSDMQASVLVEISIDEASQ